MTTLHQYMHRISSHILLLGWKLAFLQNKFTTVTLLVTNQTFITHNVSIDSMQLPSPSRLPVSTNFWTEWPLALTFCRCMGHYNSFHVAEGQCQRSRFAFQFKMRLVGPRSSTEDNFLVLQIISIITITFLRILSEHLSANDCLPSFSVRPQHLLTFSTEYFDPKFNECKGPDMKYISTDFGGDSKA